MDVSVFIFLNVKLRNKRVWNTRLFDIDSTWIEETESRDALPQQIPVNLVEIYRNVTVAEIY